MAVLFSEMNAFKINSMEHGDDSHLPRESSLFCVISNIIFITNTKRIKGITFVMGVRNKVQNLGCKVEAYNIYLH